MVARTPRQRTASVHSRTCFGGGGFSALLAIHPARRNLVATAIFPDSFNDCGIACVLHNIPARALPLRREAKSKILQQSILASAADAISSARMEVGGNRSHQPCPAIFDPWVCIRPVEHAATTICGKRIPRHASASDRLYRAGERDSRDFSPAAVDDRGGVRSDKSHRPWRMVRAETIFWKTDHH